jgi:ABC-type cobalamin/Fe3+-siderophores transport system ATPase subunit
MIHILGRCYALGVKIHYLFAALDATGLATVRKSKWHMRLSAPMGALANDPRIVLADEPTGNLDTKNSQRAFELLKTIVQQKQMALLLVTHNRRSRKLAIGYMR